MSNDLINALENRVSTAVDTIENLRAEVKNLREDRQILEDKLRELLSKMETAEDTAPMAGSMGGSSMASHDEAPAMSNEHSAEDLNSGFSPARNVGGGFSTEY